MALSKEIATEYGVPATYWKVSALNMSFMSKIAIGTIVGFVNKDIRLSTENNQNIAKRDFRVIREDYDMYFSDENLVSKDPRECFYNYVKDKEKEFEGAEDC